MATHSSVFEAIDWIAARLDDAPWPVHPDSDDEPAVGVGLERPPSGETVDVIYRIEDDASIEWVTISPASRDERYLVDIYIRTNVPLERPALWSRLNVLADVVQGVFYDPETLEFRPVGAATGGVAQAPWYLPLGGIGRVAPQAWATDKGWVGDCTVTVAVATRI